MAAPHRQRRRRARLPARGRSGPGARLRAARQASQARLEPVLRLARPAWHTVTPAGRGAITVAAAAWLLGLRLGWQELFLVAACCVIALLIAVGFVLARPSLDISIELDPARVSVGSPAAGRLVATNRSRARLRQLIVEVPVGPGRAVFQLPSLARDASHEELFIVPTARRAVIPVGPARAVRSDPLGLLRRDAVEQTVVELFVYPQIIGLDALSAGLQRDLEGQATRDLSTSDLAFHTLRDYVTGDDRRHVHWRSTAKAGKLLVRQFQDTRRSQLALVVDGAAASYRSEDEFELAMSVAGSICVRAVRDQQDACLIAASHAVVASSQRRILDTLARGSLADHGQDLAALAGRAVRLAPDTTVLMLVTGSVIPFGALRAAAIYFGPDVRVIAIRAEPDAPPGVSRSGEMTVLAVRALSDLPLLLNAAASA
ncbi:MAG: DUF58 domain-containing protein [Streptosporangiaceae bacterium]